METVATQTLGDAIEKLYDVFAVYPLNAPVTGCPHCTTPEDYARLESKPLRELTDDDLRKYASKALTTWGGVEDFKHFLPRLFELIAWYGYGSSVDPQIVFGKLPYSKSNGEIWSEAEQQAIESFCLAWWQTTLDSYGNPPMEGYSCLECIGQCVDDLSPFLTVWRNDTSLSALRHIVDFVDYGSYITINSDNALGNQEGSQDKQIAAWLLDPQTKDALEVAFSRYANEPQSQETDEILAQLSDAIEKLQR
ncbi:MAG: hypothetical protein ACYDBJ_23760 [Aggregatilineales bacterium]